ncbi:hypothetical protein SOCE26_042950 [Sorangium cellulosum]|uniref:Uncharacterized protein n=1 Tax=Sorangium cellulosum TaxID=56 RepID=A0A2L0EU89_SORCE|nr:hypothetical protein [Sorangium cellulosum]AUX42860.1 hypothetical protein SOCE26_042950 [Sorangium cellulosum]
MSDESKKTNPMRLKVGDFQVGAAPVGGTSDELDTQANRERARRAEEDRRAAQFRGGREVDGAGEAARGAAEAAVDEAIQEARARVRSEQHGEDEEVPILLRDPVTGATIKHG